MGRIKEVKLVKSVYRIGDRFPEPRRGDVAFVGRSNVGKSTLLNTLFEKKVALVSKKPGKTRSINFYLVNGDFYMVDLPGYGYAKVSKEERRKWAELISNYFEKRWSLKLVFVLVDGRHGLQKKDHELLEWISQFDLPISIVLTKMDKVKRSEREKILKDFERQISEYGEYMTIPYSAVTKEGVERIIELAFNAVGVR